MKKWFLILSLLFIDRGFIPDNIYCNNQRITGTIQGILTDGETKTPLSGGNITIIGTTMGAATDQEGKFIISNVPVGNYTLKLNYIGYQSILKTDIYLSVLSLQGSLNF